MTVVPLAYQQGENSIGLQVHLDQTSRNWRGSPRAERCWRAACCCSQASAALACWQRPQAPR